MNRRRFYVDTDGRESLYSTVSTFRLQCRALTMQESDLYQKIGRDGFIGTDEISRVYHAHKMEHDRYLHDAQTCEDCSTPVPTGKGTNIQQSGEVFN